jgi:DNA-binding NarL/FixJ family response regulator
MDPVRVLIADGDPMLQDLLSLLIEQDPEMKVVGKAEDGRMAIQFAARLPPDIVLIDDGLPVLDGLEALEQIVAARPESRVLVMAGLASEERAMKAFRLGARGYLPKRGGLAVLPRAIRTVIEGEAWMERRLSGRLVEELAQLARRTADQPEGSLSTREREVLGLMGCGMTNAQIAGRLFVSPYTVKIHVSNILRKLGVPNRTEAALFAMKRGLVPDQAPPETD